MSRLNNASVQSVLNAISIAADDATTKANAASAIGAAAQITANAAVPKDVGSLGVGCFAVCFKISPGSVLNGSISAGSDLTVSGFSTLPNYVYSIGTLFGSWRNISGLTISQAGLGYGCLCQRIA